ncbi:energy transducer TonB [Anatilimnocola floriformis]|uniref:energy transducer TonB n=1 Tax=Anatilimnocola floriformis TaxID=2948575 RepID=UPI0020C4CDA0|nr:energy transducer TonB [Anatilimnocola floriformis]
MTASSSYYLLRLLAAALASLGLHSAIVGAHALVLYLGYVAPTVVIGGGGSSGIGGKPGEGGVNTVDAVTTGFSLRRVLAKSDDGDDETADLTATAQDIEITPAETKLEKATAEIATAVRPDEPEKVYLTERPAPAVIKPLEAERKEDVPEGLETVEAKGGPKLTRKTSKTLPQTGVISVTASDLKAAAGKGAGLQGGTNGEGAGNGGGGRPGAGRGGGVGAGIGIGAGRAPGLANGNRAPHYPAEAQRLGHTGRVLLRVTVKPDGTADNVALHETSSYPSLDESAIAAVKGWRFTPAQQFGQPVEATVIVPVKFVLQ